MKADGDNGHNGGDGHGGSDGASADPVAVAVAAAVHTLLTAGPDGRAVLDPRLVADIGDEEDLDDVLGDVHKLLGPVLRVAGTAEDGLVAEGVKGRVQVWGAVGADGRLTGLLFGDKRLPAPETGGPVRRRVRSLARGSGRRLWLLYPLVFSLPCWTQSTVTNWLAGPLMFAVAGTVSIGLVGSATLSRGELWAWSATLVSMLAGTWRLTYLPFGHPGYDDAIIPLGFVVVMAMTVRDRLHDRNRHLSQPLRFPLTGTWYVARGGERLVNRHAPYIEQRGAVELVGLGPDGRGRPGADSPLTAYPAYGSPLHAPCDGVVTRATDGFPDAPPGRPRFGPPEGNHLRIDTGHETVVLAHLKPGSLRVSPGERVRTGQLLAEIGNSGNTTEPHLHLHAERDGEGVGLRFTELGSRRLWPGRRITVPAPG